jgi:hypothetical protein
MLTGAHREALAWLRTNAPAKATVFDIGVGPGYFLRTIRKLGFTPMGLDVAEEPVRLLIGEGYQVWHGTVETVPMDWPKPAICTVFFVLHHLTDPIAFLRSIRVRFSDAVLVVAQHNTVASVISSGRPLSPEWLPPRTLSFWGQKSLRKAMELAGYEVERVGPVAMTELDYYIPGTRSLYLTLRRYLQRWLPTYYAVKPVLFKPVAALDRLRGRAASVLSIGRPVQAV